MVLFTVPCQGNSRFQVVTPDHSLHFCSALTISFGCSQPRVLPLAFAAVAAWLLGYSLAG